MINRVIKIAIPILAGLGIIWFVVNNWGGLGLKSDEIRPTVSNQYVDEINRRSNELQIYPAQELRINQFKSILFEINDFANRGYFSQIPEENSKLKVILTKNLIGSYVSKFIEKSNIIFNGSQWSDEDMSEIEDQLNYISKFQFIDYASWGSQSLRVIGQSVQDFKKAKSIIDECEKYKYTNFDLNVNYEVPQQLIEDLNAELALLPSLKLHNCIRIANGLNGSYEILYNKQLAYLNKKIEMRASEFDIFSDINERY
jgi:hypothetical protein